MRIAGEKFAFLFALVSAGAMGIWWPMPVQRAPSAYAGVGDIYPDEVPPARFGPITAAFAIGSSDEQHCRSENGTSALDAGR
jgi:hypothetical protein